MDEIGTTTAKQALVAWALGVAGHGKPGPARPGPKMAWPIGPNHVVGPGLGRNLWPDRSNGPGLGRKNEKLLKARPDGPTIFLPDGPGLGRKTWPDIGPGRA
jgi:hypothetical protein